MGEGAATRPVRLPTIDLSALRSVLAHVHIEGEPDSVMVEGTGLVDFRSASPRWSVALEAAGGAVRWRDIPVRRLQGAFSADQDAWKGTGVAALTHGNVQVSAEPVADRTITFSGTAQDAAGRSSRFEGAWAGEERSLHVHRVTGHADWFALAGDVPAFVHALPPFIAVRRFPGLNIEDLVWKPDPGGKSAWTVGSIELTSPATVSITLQSHPLTLNGLTGLASSNGRQWKFRQVRAGALGGTVQLEGQWGEGVLSQATLTGESLELAAMSPWLGRGSQRLDGATARFEYHGQLGKHSRLATGRGSLRLNHAPMVEIPLLDQTYRFFAAAVPGGPPPGPSLMTAAFEVRNGVMHVASFTAQSQAVVVSGAGTIDFPAQTVDARARGELRGVAGWATQPLSRALAMNITGPITQPRVTAQNPAGMAGGLIQGAAESAVDALQLPGQAIERAASFPQRLWRALRPDD